MKSKILAFVAVLTCLCFTASPLCVGAEVPPEIAIEILETVGSYLLLDDSGQDATQTGYADGFKTFVRQTLEKAFGNPVFDPVTGEQSFVLSNFDFVTGKYQMIFKTADYNQTDWTINEVKEKAVLVEVTMCLSDTQLGFYTDKNTGITYWPNGLNIAITRPDNWITGSNMGGNVKHYFVEFSDNFNYSRQVSFNANKISVTEQGGCKLYSVTGSSRSLMETNFYTDRCVFTFNDTNDITVVANDTGAPSQPGAGTGQTSYPLGVYSYRGSTITSPGVDLPIDKDICHGQVNLFFRRYNSGTGQISGSVSQGVNMNRYLSCGFVATNNSMHGNFLVTNNIDNSQKNYYVSNFTGGTVIDKDSEIGTKIAPAFELDPEAPDFLDDLLALIPTLLELLDGDILSDLAGLVASLLDFFTHMPEIGMQWNPDLQLNPNNYFELDLPSYNPPDSGGGGSGGDVNVTVDVNITRPQIPVINTSPHVTLYYPTVTTTALPSNIIEAGAEFVDWGKEITDLTGTTNIIIICGLIGVGVMLIFKDW